MRICKGSGSESLGNILTATVAVLMIALSVAFVSFASAEQSCQDIDPITEFYPPAYNKIIVFGDPGSDITTKLRVPTGLNVYSATMSATGIPVASSGIINPADIVVVNDVSGSMDDNCPGGNADPGESPCKINDMKEATKGFVDILLDYESNTAGLVSYSTGVVDWMALTNDKAPLFAEVDSYVAMNETCISCAIEKGIELLEESQKEIKAMLLMTDGKANRCTYGVCTPEMAKEQALNRAGMAWLYYNISIYTVAFGDDADTVLMEQIADVSNGVYYYAADTDIIDVYNQIAIDVTLSYPTDLTIDIGTDGILDWSYPGQLISTETIDFAPGLQSVTDCTCTGCAASGDDCIIDVEVSTETAGMFILDYLEITGCMPGEQEPPEPADHVLFYQVYYDTIGSDYLEEWFEIYNPTESAVDIGGWRIYDNTGAGTWYDVPEAVSIGPGDYMTIARDSDGFYALYGCYPDLDQFHRQLSNDGDLLKLTDSTGLGEIDFVAWENWTDGPTYGWEDVFATMDKSIIRDPANIDTDMPGDWLSDQDPLPKCVREPCEDDSDGDGYVSVDCGGDDCDDSDYNINPGATEVCNMVDDNCNDEIDEGVENTYYWDGDNDGYGNPGNTYDACWPPEGYITDSTDCDDSNPDINPGEEEVCDDDADNNCDGYVDEGCYADQCEDIVCESYCEDGDWYYNGDCDEGICSYDIIHESENCVDSDEDGYEAYMDCNDTNPDVNPGATEICNGVDDDCDGTVDEGCDTGSGTVGGGGGDDGSGLCLPAWDCTAWSDCVDNQQTRDCVDIYHCNTNYNNPPTAQSCGEPEQPAFVCSDGARNCDGDALRECVNNAWQGVEICQWGCADGECSPEPDEVVEEEGTTGPTGFITAGSPEFWGIIIAIIVIIAIAIWLKKRKK
jgi:hypothetical protein